MRKESTRLSRWVTALLCVATLLLYAQALQQWGFVGDDAYISFRYAKNLVEGAGLVWNPGDVAVEGYTNFGWVMLTALGLWLGLSAETTVLGLGVASGLGVLLLLTRLSAQRRSWADPIIFAAPLMLASTRSFAAWSTSGLETMGYTVLLFAGLLMADTERVEQQERPWRSSLLLTGAVFMRPDGLLFAAIVGAFHAWDALRGRRSWRSLWAWVWPAVALLGAHEAFRIVYYGDWVPNTFRVKVNGSRWKQGWAYLDYAHQVYGLAWWAWLALIPAVWRRQRLEVLLTVSLIAHVLYVVYVGGDRFELRFLVPVMPAFLWLVVEAVALLTARLGRAQTPVMVVAALLGAYGLHVGSNLKMGAIRNEVEQVPFIAKFAAARAERGKALRAHIDAGRLPTDIRLCVGAAGALPYYADLWALDFFGLNDREIARQEIPEGTHMIPGHEKKADTARLVAEDVDMFDASGLLVTHDLGQARHAWEKSKRKLRKMHVTDELTLVCHHVEDDWLIFVTSHTPERHAARYGHLPSCDAEMEAKGKGAKTPKTAPADADDADDAGDTD